LLFAVAVFVCPEALALLLALGGVGRGEREE